MSNARGDFPSRYGEWVLHRRWTILLVSIFLFFLSASGTRYVSLNDNYRVFFSPDNPHLHAMDALEETYAKEENILYALLPEDGDVFTPRTLGAIEELTEASWQIEHCRRVDSITNFQHTYAEEDDIVVEDLVSGAAGLAADELSRVRGIALSEPLLVDKLVSRSGDAAVVNVTLQLPGLGSGEREAPVKHSREIAAAFKEKYPEIELRTSGGAVTSYAFSEYTMRDMTRIVLPMYLLVTVLVGASVRSFGASMASIGVIIMSIGTAMGAAGWTGLNLTAATANMPTIVMTLAVADSIHILVVMLAQMREGKTKRDALLESIRINLNPVFLTSFTTCIGLLSMNFTPVPPLQDFGNMTAMGVVAAFFYSVTFLPAFMAVIPLRVAPRSAERRSRMAGIAEYVIAKRSALFWGFLAATVILGAFIPQNDLRNNWINWFKESTEFRQDVRFMREHVSGVNSIEFSIPSGEPSGINDPEYLAKLDGFSAWLREQPEIDHASTITDIVKRLNMNMHGDDPDYYRIPESKELSAQYLLLYEMSLPYGMDLNNQIDVDKSATRVQVVTDNLDSTQIDELRVRCEQWWRDNAPETMWTHGTGSGVMFASIAAETIRGMVLGTPLALICVSLTLVVSFRSLRLGLLSLVPNLVPLVMAYGVWALLIGRINFGVACVAGLSIGIVVDDTVHFMSKYLRARREHNASAEDAVRYAYATVGRAMVVTSVILMIGFGMLIFSVYRFNSYMGLLTSITIAFALAADMFFLPTVLMRYDVAPSVRWTGDRPAETQSEPPAA